MLFLSMYIHPKSIREFYLLNNNRHDIEMAIIAAAAKNLSSLSSSELSQHAELIIDCDLALDSLLSKRIISFR
jgi:hypothetical protein